MKYSYLLTLKKGLKFAVILFLSLLATGASVEYPEVWNFTLGTTTIGTLAIMVIDYLKHKVGFRLP